MTTKVVNLRKEPYDVYIGRAGKGQNGYFGNPVRVNHKCCMCGQVHATGEATLPCYEQYFLTRIKEDPMFKESVLELKDKTLACFCKTTSLSWRHISQMDR